MEKEQASGKEGLVWRFVCLFWWTELDREVESLLYAGKYLIYIVFLLIPFILVFFVFVPIRW